MDKPRARRRKFKRLVRDYEIESLIHQIPGLGWDRATTIAEMICDKYDVLGAT